jgi:hypothetical protein
VRLLYLKIGKESYPSKPTQRIKDELKPPGRRFKKDDRQLVADLLSLCCRKDESPVATIDATCRPKFPSKINSNKTMCNNFNICKLDKAALALHLVKRFHPTKAIYTLITTQNIKVGHSVLCFSSTTKAKSTVYVSFCLSWTMVRGLRRLGTILMCENKRFHPTKAIYTLITTQNIKVRHSILYFSSTTKTKSTIYVSFCLS